MDLDWELKHIVIVENVDTKGGTFVVVSEVYDGNRLVIEQSGKKYIASGKKVEFIFKTEGLSYSTDWKNRYNVYHTVESPMKIESYIETKYKTKNANLIAFIESKVIKTYLR